MVNNGTTKDMNITSDQAWMRNKTREKETVMFGGNCGFGSLSKPDSLLFLKTFRATNKIKNGILEMMCPLYLD